MMRHHWLLLLLILTCCACTGTRKQTALMKQTELTISADELRARVRGLINPSTGAVNTACRRMFERSDEPMVIRRVKTWRVETVTVLHTALLYDDPLASIIETCTYLMQQRDFLHNDPRGPSWFGSDNTPILAALDIMLDELLTMADSVAGDPERVVRFQDTLSTWAAKHPLTQPWLGRPSVQGDIAALVGSENIGTLGTISRLSDDIGTISARLAAYNDHLPHRLAWEMDLLIDHQLDKPAIQELSHAAAALPAMREELTAIRTLTDERTKDADSLLALAATMHTRLDSMEQRLNRFEAHLAGMHSGIATVGDELSGLRHDLDQRLNTTVKAALDQAGRQADRFFWTAMACSGAFLSLLFCVALWWWRPRPR